jgi:hypothetical protein
VKLITLLQLVLSLRIYGVVPAILHTPEWRAAVSIHNYIRAAVSTQLHVHGVLLCLHTTCDQALLPRGNSYLAPAFCSMTPYSLVGWCQRFGRTSCLSFDGGNGNYGPDYTVSDPTTVSNFALRRTLQAAPSCTC